MDAAAANRAKWFENEDRRLQKAHAAAMAKESDLRGIDPLLVSVLGLNQNFSKLAPADSRGNTIDFEMVKLRESADLAAYGHGTTHEALGKLSLGKMLLHLVGEESLLKGRTTLPTRDRSLLAADDFIRRHHAADANDISDSHDLKKLDSASLPPPAQDWTEVEPAYAGGKRPVDESTMGFRRANPKHASRERAEGFIDRIAGIFTARGASEEAIAEMRDRCMEMLDEADEAVLETFPEKLAAALAG